MTSNPDLLYLQHIQQEYLERIGLSPVTAPFYNAVGRGLQLRETLFLDHYALPGDDRSIIDPAVRETHFTSFEGPLSTFLLWYTSDRVRSTFHRYFSFPLPEEPILLGTLPFGQINSRIFRSPRGRHIIAFNVGFYPLLYGIIKNVVKTHHIQSIDGQTQYVVPDPSTIVIDETILTDFEDLICAYLIQGYINDHLFDFASFVDAPQFGVAPPFLRIAYYFVMAHEYAHIFLELSDSKSPISAADPTTNWPNEYQADQIALTLAFYHFSLDQSIPPPQVYAVVDLFFSLIEGLQEFLPQAIDEKHPPVSSRRQQLRGYIRYKYDYAYAASCHFGDLYAGLVHTLFRQRADRIRERVQRTDGHREGCYFYNTPFQANVNHDALLQAILSSSELFPFSSTPPPEAPN